MKQENKIYKKILWGEEVWEFWSELAQSLEKKKTIFQLVDFDYTLFSRDKQLIEIPDLAKNRADLGPLYLFQKYGMSKFLEEYYTNVSLPTKILSKLDSSRDIIMTAWGSKDFQIAKVRSCKQLDDFKVVLTKDGQEKIPELIRHVLFELRYIPSEIIIYEDRPQYFVEYKELIESVLWTKLTIMYVEMDSNEGYKKIEEV